MRDKKERERAANFSDGEEKARGGRSNQSPHQCQGKFPPDGKREERERESSSKLQDGGAEEEASWRSIPPSRKWNKLVGQSDNFTLILSGKYAASSSSSSFPQSTLSLPKFLALFPTHSKPKFRQSCLSSSMANFKLKSC